MKMRRWLLVIASVLMLQLTCQKNPAEPHSTPKSEEPILQNGLELLASETIGPEGGRIDLDSIIIDIPPAAFQQQAALHILSVQGNSPFGENAISNALQIDGLPDQFNPIQIKINCNNVISGDTLVALGEKGFAKSLRDSVFSFIVQKATAENGQLVFSLGKSPSLSKNLRVDNIVGSPVRITPLSGYTTSLSDAGHFVINHPVELASQAEQLGAFFEAAYDTFQAMGFSYAGKSWPVPVTVADMAENGAYTFYMPAMPTDITIRSNLDKGRFAVSKNIMNDVEKLATTAGHEFMHLVQNLYEFSDPYIMPEQIWLSGALAVWAEGKFSTAPNYISPEIVGNEIQLFLGWQHASALHGYGMSALFKTIAEAYGDAAIVSIIENIRDGRVPSTAVDPVDAVLSALTDPVERFWHQVLGDYIMGNLYDGSISRALLENPSNFAYTFVVDGPEDTLTTMLCGFNDLSGALIKLNLDYAGIDSTAILKMAVDDSTNCGMLLCALKNGAINPLTETSPGQGGYLERGNLHQMTQAGQDLVLLVSHGRHQSPYSGTNDVLITLEIDVPKNSGPAGSPPNLDISNDMSMGYWKYLATFQTPGGQGETLFTYKLDDPAGSATATIFKPDSGWIYSQPINGISALEFTGAHLATVAPDICPGTADSIYIHVENEFGSDTSFVTIAVGEFFDGVQIADSSANWSENFIFPVWYCEDNSLIGPFRGSTLKSNVNRQNYICGNLSDIFHSSIVRFDLDFGCRITGEATCDYTILANHNQPAKEYWKVQFNFDSPFKAAITTPNNSDYFLFVGVSEITTSISQKEVWTFSDKPDTIWTKTSNPTGGMLLGIEGQILY